MDIVLIEPYFTGSHRSWAEGLKEYSSHTINLLTMTGKFWKWRMHGGSITMAREFIGKKYHPDLIIASDMLNLSTFLGLTREQTHDTPVIMYLHENQLTYPWSPTDRDVQKNRDRHYSFINLVSALSADHVCFNSEYHRRGFIDKLRIFLNQFPDYNELSSIEKIESMSTVLPVGIDLSRFDRFNTGSNKHNRHPHILWNHRWEYDKNPETFFKAVYELKAMNTEFRLILLGEHFVSIPDEFTRAKERLDDKIVQFGFARNFDEYARLLWKSDIIPVTSYQDFFGISIVEAVYCNTIPLLPERLTYGELFPASTFGDVFYRSEDELAEKLASLANDYTRFDRTRFRRQVEQYDWKNIIDRYDALFEAVAG